MSKKRTSRFAPAYPAPEPPQPPQGATVESEAPNTPVLTGSLTAAEHAILRDRYFEQKAFAQILVHHNERALFRLGKALKKLEGRR